ncbi:MAG: hypothetical protein Q4C95_11635 [Planctomycetia bacterium]|nr:hypothetical protein [Planctomycetia bacterium]
MEKIDKNAGIILNDVFKLWSDQQNHFVEFNPKVKNLTFLTFYEK